MRHCKSGRKLNRTSSHRSSMFQNMMISLIHHKIIKTTLSRAKELRCVIEPIITLSKVNTVANRRLVFCQVRDRSSLGILFNKLGPYFIDRPGGYTRILKYGFRTGDNAAMAYIELVGRTFLEEDDLKIHNRNK